MSDTSSPKKRARRPRKIVPRGQMGPMWVIAPLILAGLIVAAGVIYVLTR